MSYKKFLEYRSLTVFNDTIIYIFCPDGLITGGPEALHQLRYYLEQCGYTAFLVYCRSGNTVAPKRYTEYDPEIISYQKVIDNKHNIVIVSETETAYLKKYRNLQKCVWWLSYDFYQAKNHRIYINCKNFLKRAVKRVLNLFRSADKKFSLEYNLFCPNLRNGNLTHLCGSEYARLQIARNLNIEGKLLVEPISKDFLIKGKAENLASAERGNAVLYNPKKPSQIMQKLLKRSDLTFIPLQGMSPDELIALYRKSKLYVDFGEFGGPERIPKETVYNGTCILVGKRNAAVNTFDVAIPDEFKIENFNDEDIVALKIHDMLEHYDDYIDRFEYFRDKVDRLEENFISQIKEYFPIQEN